MSFFRVSQVEDKKWMIARLADLPGWREVSSFDEKQAAQHNAELAARLDEMAERAASLRFARNCTWATLRVLIESQAQASYDQGSCHGGNMGIVPRLIDDHIPDTRRSLMGVAALASPALLCVGLVIAGVIAGWSLLLWLLLGVPIAAAIALLMLSRLLIGHSNRLIERWFQGVWGLISGPRDYLELTPSEARDILAERWQSTTAHELIGLLDELIRRHQEMPAYSLTVAMALARLGYAAEYLTRRETFGYNNVCLRLVAKNFDSWEALGQAMDQAWRRGAEARGESHESERISQNMDYMRGQVWPGCRFNLLSTLSRRSG
jgi:hypothetical protein